MSLQQLIPYIFLLLMPIFVQAGGDSAGGGYAIQCGSALYSLDFKATELSNIAVDSEIEDLANSTVDSVLIPASDLIKTKKILELIAFRLEVKLPNLGKSLRAFARLNEDPKNKSSHRLWQAKPALIRIPNELTFNISDKSCFNETGLRNSYQAAIRYSNFQAIYDFDPKIRDRLGHNPIQLSFFYIHEWLRDYIDDPDIIAEIDRLFHSAKLNKLTDEKLSEYLISKGFAPVLIGPTFEFMELYRSGKLSEKERARCDRTDMIALSEITEKIISIESHQLAVIEDTSKMLELQLKKYKLNLKRRMLLWPCSAPDGLIN